MRYISLQGGALGIHTRHVEYELRVGMYLCMYVCMQTPKTPPPPQGDACTQHAVNLTLHACVRINMPRVSKRPRPRAPHKHVCPPAYKIAQGEMKGMRRTASALEAMPCICRPRTHLPHPAIPPQARGPTDRSGAGWPAG